MSLYPFTTIILSFLFTTSTQTYKCTQRVPQSAPLSSHTHQLATVLFNSIYSVHYLHPNTSFSTLFPSISVPLFSCTSTKYFPLPYINILSTTFTQTHNFQHFIPPISTSFLTPTKYVFPFFHILCLHSIIWFSILWPPISIFFFTCTTAPPTSIAMSTIFTQIHNFQHYIAPISTIINTIPESLYTYTTKVLPISILSVYHFHLST